MALKANLGRVMLLAAVASLLPGAAFAQSYPVKSIRWIAPFPPGGGTDLISRALAQKLADAWGQQVLVDNRPGSGGTIGLALAAKAPADGYTVVLGQLANVAIAPALYSKLPYDPVRDLAPVTLVLSAPLFGLLFDLSLVANTTLALSLLLGTPILSLLGGLGAALTLGLRSGAVLLILIILPLCIPALIFGAGAVSAAEAGISTRGHFSLLGALLIGAVLLAPLATGSALRIATE